MFNPLCMVYMCTMQHSNLQIKCKFFIAFEFLCFCKSSIVLILFLLRLLCFCSFLEKNWFPGSSTFKVLQVL